MPRQVPGPEPGPMEYSSAYGLGPSYLNNSLNSSFQNNSLNSSFQNNGLNSSFQNNGLNSSLPNNGLNSSFPNNDPNPFSLNTIQHGLPPRGNNGSLASGMMNYDLPTSMQTNSSPLQYPRAMPPAAGQNGLATGGNLQAANTNSQNDEYQYDRPSVRPGYFPYGWSAQYAAEFMNSYYPIPDQCAPIRGGFQTGASADQLWDPETDPCEHEADRAFCRMFKGLMLRPDAKYEARKRWVQLAYSFDLLRRGIENGPFIIDGHWLVGFTLNGTNISHEGIAVYKNARGFPAWWTPDDRVVDPTIMGAVDMSDYVPWKV
ncbi:hypothetical protein F5B20DRAFT_583088 [Whalleya microplaca]|nr:hypothetical protein F5B20DRAFT_583088 [Whalleya microplaca]